MKPETRICKNLDCKAEFPIVFEQSHRPPEFCPACREAAKKRREKAEINYCARLD